MAYKNSKTAGRRRYKSRYHSPHNYKTKRSKSENRAAILVAIATFVVIAGLVLVFTFGESIYNFLDTTFTPMIAPTQAPTESVTETATQPATEASTQAPTEAPTVTQDADFAALAKAAGIDPAATDSTQLILVKTEGTTCTVYTYEKDADGVWQQKFDPVAGFIGSGGAAAAVGPYDTATPLGTYQIEYAIGTNPDPGTALTYYQIYYGMRWITDPASINYNRMVDGNASVVDWNDCQWLHEYTRSYPYAIVFDYNRNPVDVTQGCARFLHVAYDVTAGGVGIAESDLQGILLWLDPSAAAAISIF